MYRISIENVEQFKTFLSINDSEYIDAILTKDMAVFITNSTEILGLFMQSCSSSANETGCNLRIPRGLLKKLIGDGGFDINLLAQDQVAIRFYDTEDNCRCQASFRHLQVFNSAYVDKMKLIKNFRPTRFIDSNTFHCLSLVSKLSSALINVDAEVACVVLSAGIKVFKEVPFKDSFCISSKSYEVLRRCNHKFFSVEEFMGALQGNLAVLVTKARPYSNQEFQPMTDPNGQFKAKYLADINLSNLTSFLNLQKMRVETITIDVLHKRCSLNYAEIQYQIPVLLQNEKEGGTGKFAEFSIPGKVIEQIVLPLKEVEFEFKKKKTFSQLRKEDIYILFS